MTGNVRSQHLSAPSNAWGRQPISAAAENALPTGLRKKADDAADSVVARPVPHSGIHEALAQLRSRILASVAADRSVVLGVCSAVEGEGKTTVAVALAELLAQSLDQKVALVDANTQMPRLHTLMETSASPGLQDCLDNTGLIDEALELRGGLWVMPAGTTPARYDASTDISKVFRRLRSFLRVTIVDLPAVGDGVAALRAARWVDEVIWVVRAESTPPEIASQAMEVIGRQRIMGIVLNGHQSRIPGWLRRLL